MESIKILTERTTALETKLNMNPDDSYISSMGTNFDGPAHKRRMMEGRRSAPPSYSAPSNASTRASEANPAIIW
eukprot:11868022-Heterocapsa_arctica.AAC.1